MVLEVEKFIVSQAGILIRNNKCLIGEISNRPGVWDIPGGRVNVDEIGEVALRREIKEELGLHDFEIIDVVDYDVWYTKNSHIPVCAIANLIKNDIDEIKISNEHLRFEWITEDEIDDYNFVWPSAKKMLKKGFKKYNEII